MKAIIIGIILVAAVTVVTMYGASDQDSGEGSHEQSAISLDTSQDVGCSSMMQDSTEYVLCLLTERLDDLPSGEDPNVERVEDVGFYTSLPTNFYNNLAAGDYIVSFRDRVIIYRSTTDEVVADGFPQQVE